jgi:hypothetical protein
MAYSLSDTSPRAYAKVTGVLYLLIIAFGLFSEMWVRARLGSTCSITMPPCCFSATPHT